MRRARTSAWTSALHTAARLALVALLLAALATSWRLGAAPLLRAQAAAADTLRFVAHPETYPIGWPSHDRPLTLVNPFERNPKALALGAKLYVAYNCVDCHGADGNGSMGPSLADGRWHFGGEPAQVFESIYEGRPDGMPAWGGRIAEDQLWMLVTYVRSLNGGRNLSTMNFSGRLVERSGH